MASRTDVEDGSGGKCLNLDDPIWVVADSLSRWARLVVAPRFYERAKDGASGRID